MTTPATAMSSDGDLRQPPALPHVPDEATNAAGPPNGSAYMLAQETIATLRASLARAEAERDEYQFKMVTAQNDLGFQTEKFRDAMKAALADARRWRERCSTLCGVMYEAASAAGMEDRKHTSELQSP